MPLITFEGSEGCGKSTQVKRRELAKNEPKRVVLIDGRMSVDAIENEIQRTISTRFPELAANQRSAISNP